MKNDPMLDLVRSAQKHDPVAEVALFNQVRPMVERQIRSILRDQMFAFEDASANALAAIFTKLSKFQPKGSFESWARTIATNATLDVLRAAGCYDHRSAKRQAKLEEKLSKGKAILPVLPKPKDLLSTQDMMTPPAGDAPQSNLADVTAFKQWLSNYHKSDGRPYDVALAVKIASILDKLPTLTQQVFQMRLDGLSHEVLAERLSITPGNARVRYTRAIAAVHKALGITDQPITRRTITQSAVQAMKEL